jgi:hypothetical protein
VIPISRIRDETVRVKLLGCNKAGESVTAVALRSQAGLRLRLFDRDPEFDDFASSFRRGRDFDRCLLSSSPTRLIVLLGLADLSAVRRGETLRRRPVDVESSFLRAAF